MLKNFLTCLVAAAALPPTVFVHAEELCYLDSPRINISGTFYCDPSTVNNDPLNFSPTVVRPSPWQDPAGMHYWQLRDCTVESVVTTDGSEDIKDSIVGGRVVGTDEPSVAKLVDLDPYQQGVSTIYGFAIKIELDPDDQLVAKMDPPALRDAWFNRVLPQRGWNLQYGWGSPGGDAEASGVFQTTLRVPVNDWPTNHDSEVLDELRKRTLVENGEVVMSFRFVLDAFVELPKEQGGGLGRFTGVIGPYSSNMPVQTPGVRLLNPRAVDHDAPWFVPRFNHAPFKVDANRKVLVVDLSNALCQETVGGNPVDLGDLNAVVIDAQGKQVILGELDYRGFSYSHASGIAETPLTDEQIELLSERPLAVVMSRTDIGPATVLSEDPSGVSYAVDNRVLRMTSEENSAERVQTTRVHVTRWGKPAPGVEFDLDIVPVVKGTPGSTGTPNSPGNTPQSFGKLAGSVTPSDEHGFAEVRLEVNGDPGSRYPNLDGQLYFAYPAPKKSMPWMNTSLAAQDQARRISVKAYSQYEIPEKPTWSDVQVLMEAYENYYPAMKELIRLTDRDAMQIFGLHPPWVIYGESPDYSVQGIDRGAIPYFMTRDFDDPRYMPLTRDMSPNRMATVIRWFSQQQPTDKSATEDAQVAAPDEPAPRTRNLVADALPFDITVEEVEYPKNSTPPALHSYVCAVLPDGRWLILNGRTNGLHTFNPVEDNDLPEDSNFKPEDANHWIWVIDPKDGVQGRFDVRLLAPKLAEQMQSTNPQFWHDPDNDGLYIAGGYGASGDDMVTFQQLMWLPPTKVAEIILGKGTEQDKADRITGLVRTVVDERFQSTGGGLDNIDGVFYLVFGQVFTGHYSPFGMKESDGGKTERDDDGRRKARPYTVNRPAFKQYYTEEIRLFTLDPKTLAIKDYDVMRSDEPGSPFHRRDGNIVSTIDPATGKQAITAFGGVFKPGEIAAYTKPIDIPGPNSFKIVDHQQVFNQYGCPVLVIHDEKNRRTMTTFFAGISNHYHHQTNLQQARFNQAVDRGMSDGHPFVSDITTIVRHADGAIDEYLHVKPMPGHALQGSSTGFIPLNDASSIVRFDDIKEGETVVVGYIYGGLEANNPLTLHPGRNGGAGDRVYRVSITRKPTAAMSAREAAIGVKVTPGFMHGL